ncbi:FAD-dependent monooxygenase [Vibrio chagasii]|nr:FAD-dependent monooxygenase [Vibrio chagasii]
MGLWSQFDAYDNLELLCPEKLDSIEFGETNIVKLQSGIELLAKWVVGADGANSAVRQQAGLVSLLGTTASTVALYFNVETELPQQDITWQQFLPSGPRSFLPLCSLVQETVKSGRAR